MTPERWRDQPEDEPPDDERNDERRACTREQAELIRDAFRKPAAEQKWMDSLPPWDS